MPERRGRKNKRHSGKLLRKSDWRRSEFKRKKKLPRKQRKRRKIES